VAARLPGTKLAWPKATYPSTWTEQRLTLLAQGLPAGWLELLTRSAQGVGGLLRSRDCMRGHLADLCELHSQKQGVPRGRVSGYDVQAHVQAVERHGHLKEDRRPARREGARHT